MRYLLALAGLLLAACSFASAQQGTEDLTLTFDGAPATPVAYGANTAPGLDVHVHARDQLNAVTIPSLRAHHDAMCGNPYHDGSGTHPVAAYEDLVYQCANHLMTVIADNRYGGYAAIYLTPDHLAVIDGDTTVVSFDTSTLDRSHRDWLDVWLTPWDQNLTAPLRENLPDGQGRPLNAINIEMETNNCKYANHDCDGDLFRVVQTVNGVNHTLPQASSVGWDNVLTPCTGPSDPSTTCGPSAKNRYEIRIEVSRTHIRVSMPATGLVWVDADLFAPFPSDRAVVQFAHHDYDAPKDVNPSDGSPGTHNTWHWDNLRISRAEPFTMIKADRRDAANGETVHFQQPAPANAHLRFSAKRLTGIAIDGGPVQQVGPQAGTGGGNPNQPDPSAVFVGYWLDVPEGAQSVTFYVGSDAAARDFGIWSMGGAEPSPTNTPTPTPSTTATSTPTPTMTPSPSPSPSVSPTPDYCASPPTGGFWQRIFWYIRCVLGR